MTEPPTPPKRPTLLGIAGSKGAGKDTIARWFVDHAGFTRVGFADALKLETRKKFRRTLLRIAPYVMPVGLEWIDGDARISPEANETAILDWLLQEKPPIVRELLQEYGSDVRRADDPAYWIKAWLRTMKDYPAVVCPDVRFPNEANLILTYGGRLLRVDRPGLPPDTHQSETSLASWQGWAATFTNTGSIADLEAQIAHWWEHV